MADLDDFFAKKDKKKGKSKKFVSSELKQLEQTVTKEKEQTNDDVEGTTNENDDKDEEWAEFEESKRPDLSNLKLGQLTFNEEQQRNQQQRNQNSGGADNESENTSQYNNDGDSSDNPWKKAQEKQQAPKEQKPATESKPGVYVPRFGGETAKSRKKNAPDLKSEEYFPSLGTDAKAAEPVNLSKGGDGFKEVTKGRKDAQTTSSSFQIPVSSVYSSLFNNEVDS